MQFIKYFQKLGFSENESLVFFTLYKLGTQPASTLSKYLQMDRTTVYKILLRLVDINLVSITEKGGAKYFFIPDTGVIKKYITQETEKLKGLDKDFEIIENELHQIQNNNKTKLPKIRLYDSMDGIKNLYDDILNEINKNSYISMRFFSSNLFDSQSLSNSVIKDYSQDFFIKLKDKNIKIETFLGNGMLIMENITKTVEFDISFLENLPAGNSSINIFIVGSIIYIVIFKEIPFGIKIDNEEFANVMHFIFDKLKIS